MPADGTHKVSILFLGWSPQGQPQLELTKENSGLLLEDEAGIAYVPEPTAVAKVFEPLGGRVRCVVLNACYSDASSMGTGLQVFCWTRGR